MQVHRAVLFELGLDLHLKNEDALTLQKAKIGYMAVLPSPAFPLIFSLSNFLHLVFCMKNYPLYEVFLNQVRKFAGSMRLLFSSHIANVKFPPRIGLSDRLTFQLKRCFCCAEIAAVAQWSTQGPQIPPPVAAVPSAQVT